MGHLGAASILVKISLRTTKKRITLTRTHCELIESGILEWADRAALGKYKALTVKPCVPAEPSNGAREATYREKDIKKGEDGTDGKKFKFLLNIEAIRQKHT
jgi:hypothetical protein